MDRLMMIIITLAYAAASAFFAWLFLERYWFWRDCIRAAKSSCLTPGGDNLTSGGAIWIVPSIVLALLAIRAALKARKRA